MKFRAAIKDGKLGINWERFNAYLSHWKEGTLLDVEVVRRVRRKSDPLRKYYFGIVLPLWMEAVGYEKNELMDVHDFLKVRYFNVQPDKRGYYKIPSVFGNNSELDVSVKKKFVDWFIRKASHDVYIPDPGE